MWHTLMKHVGYAVIAGKSLIDGSNECAQSFPVCAFH